MKSTLHFSLSLSHTQTLWFCLLSIVRQGSYNELAIAWLCSTMFCQYTSISPSHTECSRFCREMTSIRHFRHPNDICATEHVYFAQGDPCTKWPGPCTCNPSSVHVTAINQSTSMSTLMQPLRMCTSVSSNLLNTLHYIYLEDTFI